MMTNNHKSLKELEKARLEKLKFLKSLKINPYPVLVKRDYLIDEVLKDFDKLAQQNKTLSVVGRIRSIRRHGGAQFFDIEDYSGKIQVFLSKKDIGDDYDIFSKAADEGDIIEVSGTLFLTKTGQQTIKASTLKFLSKSLLPLPSKWHGLKNKEIRFKKRYLDLIFNKEVRKIFEIRAQIISKLREILNRNGFLEVETPILQKIPGGALARPFKTFLNALDIELYLRVAPELYLKRLLVGQYEKVYEIGRNFRNEGIDWYHNPEFTMIEFYWAYQNDENLRQFTTDLLIETILSVNKSLKTKFNDKEINWEAPWAVIKFNDIIKQKTGLQYEKLSRDELFEGAKKLGLELEPYLDKGKIADEIFKKICRPQIYNPTFIIHHPIEISPLAKKLPDNPSEVARFQLVVGGMELVNAYSELNDPLDQEERFLEQSKSLKKGDKEAHAFDKDFITALKYGMPPAVGFGMGIDRLTMLITGQNTIRDVILFPFVRS